MRTIILLLNFLSFFFYSSCNNDKSGSGDQQLDLNVVSNNITVSENLKSILDKYLDSVNCSACLNEIYIQKVEPHKTIITIDSKGVNKEYLSIKRPLNVITYRGVQFFVYSGIEDYFTTTTNYENLYSQTNTSCITTTWQIEDKFGTIKINTKGGFPFLPIPVDSSYFNTSFSGY